MPWTHDSEPRVLVRGPLIVSLESLFWHYQRYPRRRVAPARPPLTERAAPREVEQPYRTGVGRAFRLPLTRRGIVLGYWVPSLAREDENAAIIEALDAAHLPGITATEISKWNRTVDILSLWDRLRAWVRQWRPDVLLDTLDDGDPEEDDVDEYRVIPWQA